MSKRFSGRQADRRYDGAREARLGTEKRPATVRVQTEERMQELSAVFEEHGWAHTIEVEPDEPEDIVELEMLLHPAQPTKAETKVGRNDPCPCGSGKKYKKCCGAA